MPQPYASGTPDLRAACPCGRFGAYKRVLPYGECCARWIEEGVAAPDVESLMRSRYTAFVLERSAYLLDTWHPDTRPAELSFTPGTKWLGLEVRRVTPNNPAQPDAGEVEFVARQRLPGGAALRMHERSRFVRIGAQWLYVNGTDMISP